MPAQTLVVRLWPEAGPAAQAVWRGYVADVRTGERFYFQTLAGLTETVAGLIGETPPPGPGPAASTTSPDERPIARKEPP